MDGRKTFASGVVNDDYCDCLDGSDEPGMVSNSLSSHPDNQALLLVLMENFGARTRLLWAITFLRPVLAIAFATAAMAATKFRALAAILAVKLLRSQTSSRCARLRTRSAASSSHNKLLLNINEKLLTSEEN
jgi:hypothetical protein